MAGNSGANISFDNDSGYFSNGESYDLANNKDYLSLVQHYTGNPFNMDKNLRESVHNLQAQAYNSAEAQKNRDWQTDLSNTAHQREVADLEAAGLNTWLSAGGAGASTPTGAPATSSAARTTDFLGPSLIHGLTSIAGSIIGLTGHKGAGAAVKAAGNFLAKNANSGKEADSIKDTSDSVQRAIEYGDRQAKISEALELERKGSARWKHLKSLLGYEGSSLIMSD